MYYMLYLGPTKLDDKQIRRMLQKRNQTIFFTDWHFRRKYYEKERANKIFS